jgi:hypothetical protein
VDEIARPGLDHVVAEQGAHAALQDEAELVLARMAVQGSGEGARRHRMLDEREPLARLGRVEDEPDADAPEEALLPVRRPDDPGSCCDAHPSLLFIGHHCPLEYTPVGRAVSIFA